MPTKTLRALSETAERARLSAQIERLKNGEAGYIMSFAGSEIPIASGLRPTLLLGQKSLVLASTPALARQARDLAENPGAAVLQAGDPLQDKARRATRQADHAQRRRYSALGVSRADRGHARVRRIDHEKQRSPFFPFLMAGSTDRAMPIRHSGGTRSGSQPRAPAPAFDAELVPDPDDLRPFLFPSVHALVVDDAGIRFISREAIPTLNPSTAVPIALAALVPAIHTAQLSRGRAQSTNNLKQIGLALHNFHSANDHFPADIRGKDGKPLLSWRVAILPFIEQQAAFQGVPPG